MATEFTVPREQLSAEKMASHLLTQAKKKGGSRKDVELFAWAQYRAATDRNNHPHADYWGAVFGIVGRCAEDPHVPSADPKEADREQGFIAFYRRQSSSPDQVRAAVAAATAVEG